MAYNNYGLENIISNNDKNINYINKNINYINKVYDISNLNKQYIISSQIRQPTNTPINWGNTRQTNTQNAYVEPIQEEVEKVLEAIHMVQRLPEDQQRQLIEATREIRYFFDGQVRAEFGGTQHYNAIRCLNNPEVTQVASALSMPNSQLAGEEFFALNRFMPNYADIADVQWWSVYRDGSWGLDTWNPQGEHLDTGVNGWGDLVGSVIKLNGKVLTPQEMIGFYRAIRLRNERGFMTEDSLEVLQSLMRALDTEGSLPRRYEEQIETAHDLGLVGPDGKTLTYTGKSMITPVTARERKQRQIGETNPEIRRIVVPTIFN